MASSSSEHPEFAVRSSSFYDGETHWHLFGFWLYSSGSRIDFFFFFGSVNGMNLLLLLRIGLCAR
ncbi:hypothetical protein RchiOBHm_Chr7g0213361 [Rosa chinensis]|uniref:Uncharacterized protein n=1 Tax=Rosa chinensis TaxID=74649 RepID=A0A2P6PB00_ROSCH|nr:hypothetical protein RchiOBHm_Chr7g0213361 [Rosa chinensis]